MMAVGIAGDRKLIRCAIGTTAFCLDLDHVRGVERADRMDHAPLGDTPGALRARGADWAVYSPAKWFGADARTDAKQVVLLESPHGRYGILVDRVTPLGRVPAGRIAPPPRGLASRWVSGVFHAADGPLPVADVDRLNEPAGAPAEAGTAPLAGGRAVGAGRWLAIGWRELAGANPRPVALAVPLPLVVEVIDAPPAQAVPGAPAHVRGMIEWRGRPLAVLDAGQWVGLEPLSESPRVVVVRSGRTPFGLAAGATVKVLPLGPLGLPSRRLCLVSPGTTLRVVDTTDATVVLPDWARFLRAGD